MTIIPIQTLRVQPFPKQSLFSWIEESLRKKKQALEGGDILILSSKIVSYFEGNVVELSMIHPTAKAKKYAKQMKANPALIQLAMDEADELITVTPWVLLTRKNGIFSSNAGVDLSNVPKGYAITWPKDPFASAKNIQKFLLKTFRLKKLAVLIIDSACQPGRKGTTSYAIGFAGIKGFQDLKGSKDLYGNILRYSALNVVDSLATAANVIMGESTESCPLAIIRSFPWETSSRTKRDEMVISSQDEMFPIQRK